MNFLWVVDKNPFDGLRPFSCECIIPPPCRPGKPELMVDNNLWIAVNRTVSFAFVARLLVLSVSEYEEGRYQGYLLVSGGAENSLWISDSKNGSFPIENMSPEKYKVVSGIPDEIDAVFHEALQEKSRVSPASHPPRVLKRVPTSSEIKDPVRRISMQLALTRKHLPYEDAYRWSEHSAILSPHASVALSKLNEENSKPPNAEEIISDIILNKDYRKTWDDQIDTNFHAIDPERITARKFFSSPLNTYHNSMEETEKAEKRHQYILKDIAARLQGLGMNLQESRSVDFLIETNEKLFLAEIKSSTPKNFLAQGSKGLFQVSSYAVALKNKGYSNIIEALIIEKNGTDLDSRRLMDVGKKFGVEVLFYNAPKPWNDRVKWLIELIKAHTSPST